MITSGLLDEGLGELTELGSENFYSVTITECSFMFQGTYNKQIIDKAKSIGYVEIYNANEGWITLERGKSRISFS